MNNEPELNYKKCPKCGGVVYYPNENDYALMRCLDCGSVFVHRKRKACENFVAKN